MKATFRRALALAPFGLTAATAVWFATQSPFAAPVVERSTEQIRAQLTRAMADTVDLQWLLPRVQDAILAEDLVELDLLLGLANDHGVVLPRPMVEDIARINDAASGFFARTVSCGACAVDITACATLAQIGACALPFELTPAGDANALRRAGLAYVEGAEIDRLDVGLAIVGLGATGVVVATGGTSYTVKAGTSVLRMARRLGTLTPPLAARLTALVSDAVRWDRMGDLARLRIGPADMVDTAKLGTLADLGGSLQRLSANTSIAETVSLLRHVDTVDDAARLARVSDAMGPQTRGAFDVLGKGRVMRATVRLSDLAVGAATALYLLALQIGVFLAHLCGNALLRTIRKTLT